MLSYIDRTYVLLRGLAVPRQLLGAALFRVLFGSFVLYQLLINYTQRAWLFGPDGVYPFALFQRELAASHSFSLYAWSTSALWFELLYHAQVVVVAAWLLGYRTRLLTPLVWVLCWSNHQRFGSLWDGGDNMGALILAYLTLADLQHGLAPLARPRPAYDAQRAGDVCKGLLHNFALLACGIQLATLYLNAGLAKLTGEYWQNGTALYYALRADEFSIHPELARRIWESPWLLTLSTYGTVGFQLALPFVLLFGTRLARIAIVGVAVVFHLSIMLMMGLVTFGMFMLAYEPLLLSDGELTSIARVARQAMQWAVRRLRLPSFIRTSSEGGVSP
jgi:antimicrobial peptide system SdpB family protein